MRRIPSEPLKRATDCTTRSEVSTSESFADRYCLLPLAVHLGSLAMLGARTLRSHFHNVHAGLIVNEIDPAPLAESVPGPVIREH
jgi:hypothetical protein